MYVCIYVCMYVYMYVGMSVCMYAYLYVCIPVCLCVSICVSLSVCVPHSRRAVTVATAIKGRPIGRGVQPHFSVGWDDVLLVAIGETFSLLRSGLFLSRLR